MALALLLQAGCSLQHSSISFISPYSLSSYPACSRERNHIKHPSMGRIPPLLRSQVRSAEAVQHMRVTSKRPHCDENKEKSRRMANGAPSDATTYKRLLSVAREIFALERKG